MQSEVLHGGPGLHVWGYIPVCGKFLVDCDRLSPSAYNQASAAGIHLCATGGTDRNYRGRLIPEISLNYLPSMRRREIQTAVQATRPTTHTDHPDMDHPMTIHATNLTRSIPMRVNLVPALLALAGIMHAADQPKTTTSELEMYLKEYTETAQKHTAAAQEAQNARAVDSEKAKQAAERDLASSEAFRSYAAEKERLAANYQQRAENFAQERGLLAKASDSMVNGTMPSGTSAGGLLKLFREQRADARANVARMTARFKQIKDSGVVVDPDNAQLASMIRDAKGLILLEQRLAWLEEAGEALVGSGGNDPTKITACGKRINDVISVLDEQFANSVAQAGFAQLGARVDADNASTAHVLDLVMGQNGSLAAVRAAAVRQFNALMESAKRQGALSIGRAGSLAGSSAETNATLDAVINGTWKP